MNNCEPISALFMIRLVLVFTETIYFRSHFIIAVLLSKPVPVDPLRQFRQQVNQRPLIRMILLREFPKLGVHGKWKSLKTSLVSGRSGTFKAWDSPDSLGAARYAALYFLFLNAVLNIIAKFPVIATHQPNLFRRISNFRGDLAASAPMRKHEEAQHSSLRRSAASNPTCPLTQPIAHISS